MNIPPPARTDPTALCSVRRLPDPADTNEWDRLFIPGDIKARCLRFVDTLALLARQRVSGFGLAQHRTLLLYGEPGCGKTSLARCVPHQWAMLHNVPALRVQTNTHALPSGERGGTQKNVQSLFMQLREIAGLGEPTFVVIDEVETLGTDRASANPNTNPLDTAFAVNSFLEAIDDLAAACPNVVFLLTTNLPRMVDRAVLDRADFHVHVPLPDAACRSQILADALAELEAAGIWPYDGGEKFSAAADETWRAIGHATEGLSARLIRHLPLVALTLVSQPAELRPAHLLAAAREHRSAQAQLTAQKGVYTYDFQQPV